MTDPNKPIINVRTTVTGEQPPAKYTPVTETAFQHQQAAPATITGARAASSTSSTANQGNIVTEIPDEFKGSSNQELIDYLERKVNEYKPLSETDLKKIRRRQKAEGIISGISDAVQSVANLISTHHYAPSMFNANDGMSAKAKARFEKEEADRKAKNDEFFNYALTLGKLRDADKQRGIQAWKTSAEQANARANMEIKLAELSLKQAQDKRDSDLHNLELLIKAGEVSSAEAVARRNKILADYAEEQQKSEIAMNNAKVNQANAAASKSTAEAGAVAQKGYPAYDRNGKLHYFEDPKAAETFSRSEGTWKIYKRKETTFEKEGRRTKTTEKWTVPGGWSEAPRPVNNHKMPGVK